MALVAAAAIAGCLAVEAGPALGDSTEALDRTAAALDAEVPALLAGRNVPGASIALVADGTIVSRAYGIEDPVTGRPMTSDVTFQAASISKPVAALVALRLVATGRLALDVPLLATPGVGPVVAGGFDPAGITLARALSHTAGLNVPGYLGFGPDQMPQTLDQSIAGASDAAGEPGAALALVAAPGSGFRYSGGGYALVEQAVETVAGKPFAMVALDEVFRPLDMGSSAFDAPGRLTARLAAVTDDMGVPAPARHYAVAAAAGLVTTSEDLARLLRGVMEAWAGSETSFLSPALAKRMLHPAPDSANDLLLPSSTWGLGWGLARTGDGALLAFHPGDNLPGWHGLVAMLPGSAAGIAILTNGPDGRTVRMEVFCRWIAAQDVGGIAGCPAGEQGN